MSKRHPDALLDTTAQVYLLRKRHYIIMHCHGIDGNDILVRYAIIYLKLTFLEIPLVKKVK